MCAACIDRDAAISTLLKPAHLVAKAVCFPATTETMRATVAKVAADLRAAEPRIGDVSAFGPGVHIGFGDGPAIILGDTGEIPLMIAAGRHHVDYRLGWLARNGDLVIIGGPVSPTFEAYQKRVLDAPGIDYHHVETLENGRRRATPAICLRNAEVYARLLSRVRDQGGTTLVAHITTGGDLGPGGPAEQG